MAGTTPSQGIPYAERPDPFQLTADLRGSFNKIDSVFAQTRGESTAAFTASTAAQAAAAQALARVTLIEDPIHVGPTEPTDGEDLWVDTDAEAGQGTQVSAADITDASSVGRNVLTAPLSVDACNALSIFTGTRALLDEGTDTAERTWDAKELHEYVTETAASAGGASSWDDLTGKPSSFPPSAHAHDDRYYTEAEVDAKIAVQSTGLRNITALQPGMEAVGTQGMITLSRVGNLVQVSLYSVRYPGANASGQHFSANLPGGFRPLTGTLLMVPILHGNTDTIRFRVTAAGQMTVYNHDGVSLLYGSVTFSTADAWPSTLPGVPA